MIAGGYDVVVTVTDSESPAVQTSATYTITITGPPPSLTITSRSPPNGTVGVDYGPSATYKCISSPVLGWHQVCTPCTSTSGCSSLPRCQGFFPSPCRKTLFLGFTFTAAGNGRALGGGVVVRQRNGLRRTDLAQGSLQGQGIGNGSDGSYAAAREANHLGTCTRAVTDRDSAGVVHNGKVGRGREGDADAASGARGQHLSAAVA